MTKKRSKTAKSLSKLLFTTVIFTTIFVLGYFFYQQRNFLITKDNQLSTLIIYIKTDKENTKLYKISVEYPVFDKAPQNLNSLIESTVASKVSEFKKQATKNWKERKKAPLPNGKSPEYPEDPFTLNINWSPQQLNNNYISFILKINSFTGGANETQDLISFNHDLKNNKEVKLEDLFPNNPDYLKNISKTAEDNLTQQLESRWDRGASYKNAKNILEKGTAPNEENFKHFTLDDNNVYFYFPKSQVAPSSFGEQKITISRNIDLKSNNPTDPRNFLKHQYQQNR
ncbi:DUF3298/DUF4163 domain-containing protein [Candidatus Parcubacteria bacterium]|nr:MAG: DUF3298/DUF4163 domain-containing protein [Candidatus Parcubacteria bacterium]